MNVKKTSSNLTKLEETTNEEIKPVEKMQENELPSKAAVIYQRILNEGNQETNRNASALLISAIAAGLTVSSSMIMTGLLTAALEKFEYIHLISSFGYTTGFILVILAKQQLFTENTVTAVIPVMNDPSLRSFGRLGRLWGLVLLGNLIGTFLMACSLYYLPAFPEAVNLSFIKLGQHVMQNTPSEMFSKGIFAGWLIATLVWILANIKTGKFIVILLITYVIALGEFTHIIVGSAEVFYLYLAGKISFSQIIYPFAIPALLGNIVGGTIIFSLLSHIQITGDMSDES